MEINLRSHGRHSTAPPSAFSPRAPSLPGDCPDRKIRNDITAVFNVSEDGVGCLRLDDNRRLDFWMELDFDIPTLEAMLAALKAKRSETVAP